MCAMYDDKNHIIEWYFDITKRNGVAKDSRPFFDDLYLDVVVTPESNTLLLNADELSDALDRGEITQAEYDLAYDAYLELRGSAFMDANYDRALCDALLRRFDAGDEKKNAL